MRLHRAGEGAAYTGLKSAGQGEGPVIPAAEQAIGTGSADELVHILTELVADEVKTRLDRVMALKRYEHGSVAAARAYVQAALGLQVWAHKLYLAATSLPHDSPLESFRRPRREETTMMWGPWGWGMGVGSLLFLALIVIGILLLVRGPSEQAPRRGEDSARRILDERLARGEIDEEEYWRRCQTLEGSRG